MIKQSLLRVPSKLESHFWLEFEKMKEYFNESINHNERGNLPEAFQKRAIITYSYLCKNIGFRDIMFWGNSWKLFKNNVSW